MSNRCRTLLLIACIVVGCGIASGCGGRASFTPVSGAANNTLTLPPIRVHSAIWRAGSPRVAAPVGSGPSQNSLVPLSNPTPTPPPCPTWNGISPCYYFTMAPGQTIVQDWYCGNCSPPPTGPGTITWQFSGFVGAPPLPAGFTGSWNPNTSCWQPYPTCYAPLTLTADPSMTPQGPFPVEVYATQLGQSGSIGNAIDYITIAQPQVHPGSTNATLSTPDFPNNAPPYIFGDPGVQAGPIQTAAAKRLPQVALFNGGGVDLFCDPATEHVGVPTSGTLSITYAAVCPVGAIIDGIFTRFDSYDFNAQHTPASTNTLTYLCGSNTCNATFSATISGTGIVKGTTWFTVHLANQAPEKSPATGYALPFNNLGQPYPQIQDTRSASSPVPVLFPSPPPTIQACPQNVTSPQPGCSYRTDKPLGTNFRTNLIKQYNGQGWPTTILGYSDAEAHHIQPLCWGGANDVKYNGVFLRDADHVAFTSWWGRTRVSGNTVTCDNLE